MKIIASDNFRIQRRAGTAQGVVSRIANRCNVPLLLRRDELNHPILTGACSHALGRCKNTDLGTGHASSRCKMRTCASCIGVSILPLSSLEPLLLSLATARQILRCQ